MNPLQIRTLALSLVAICGLCAVASAARVDNLYAAVVPVTAGESGLQKSFKAALGQVLVKVTGRRDAAGDMAMLEQFGDAGRLVQQYRINPGDEVWVRFDEVALRRELDRVGESIWGAERPTTLVWLVVDDTRGGRRLLGSLPEDGPDGEPIGTPVTESKQTQRVREQLLAAADSRGLPLLLPLNDSQEMMSVSLSDIWGGFNESVVEASRRYRPDAVLVGRARAASFGRAAVRWTLLLGDGERFDWEGDLASGPNDVADFFAARLASSVGSANRVLLSVGNVDSLDAYGRLSAYLAKLDLIEDLAVERVSGDNVVFMLNIRGDADRLMRSIALQRVLQPADDIQRSPDNDPFWTPGGPQDLRYRLMAGP